MKIVRESILLEQKKLALAAGLVVLKDDEILLVHSTNSPWNQLGIPKGHVEEGEDLLDAAIRETEEEIGIRISRDEIEDREPRNFVDYTDKRGKLYKRVYYFVARPNRPVGNFKLQLKEVDWAGFVPKKEAKKKIFWRFKELLELL